MTFSDEPWKIEDGKIISKDGQIVCIIPESERADADARLMRNAPNQPCLIHTMREWADQLEGVKVGNGGTTESIEPAIAGVIMGLRCVADDIEQRIGSDLLGGYE